MTAVPSRPPPGGRGGETNRLFAASNIRVSSNSDVVSALTNAMKSVACGAKPDNAVEETARFTRLHDVIQNMLRHYIPEITAVLDYREALPKPGLKTPEGNAIRKLLEEKVNPSIAAHGGRITLVDLQKDRAYVRLDGGCQGCGMADVTLKQGVAVEIQNLVPSITEVLDVTDHADGTNPYYQPA